MINKSKLEIKNSPRVALVHDYLKEWGGAEAVFETLTDIFPDADLYTSIYRPQFLGPHRSRLEKKWNHRLHQSWFGHLPLAHKLLSPFRFLSPLAFKTFNFRGYDLIIVSATGAFFPNSLNKRSAKLICYCHTPPRYLYGLATARDTSKLWFINWPLQFVLHFYRLFDFKFAQNVDQFIANSATTAARIHKFYRRDSVVINPPIDIPATLHKSYILNRKSFFLTGGRLARAKRYDIAIHACNLLKLPLKVFGRDFSGHLPELQKIAGPTIEFVGEVTQEEKTQLFSQAQAYIFASDNEDFGMVSVEAQGHGCPVIGYNCGGIAETVIDGQTGVLFDELTPTSCARAIERLQKIKIEPTNCTIHAQNFSQESFVKKISQLVT